MSSGHFSRTNRNQTPKGLNKSEDVSQISTNPSQITNVAEENKGGYVYKPPSRIARTNVQSTVVKQETKTQQKIVQSVKVQQPKIMGFVKKPIVTQSPQRLKTQPPAVVQQVKPVVVNKPISRLANKNTDLFGLPVVAKKQQPPVSQVSSTKQLLNKQPIKPQTKPKIQQPIKIINNTGSTSTSALKRGLMQQLNNAKNNTQSMPTLDIKKPINPYSYPKKITPRTSQKFENQETNKNVQQKKQQPKFSRTAANSINTNNSVKQQTPQVQEIKPVSKYTYQRKPVQKTQLTPIKAQEPIKQVSKQIQSSPAVTKSPISQVPRYRNVPPSNSTNEINKAQQQPKQKQQNQTKKQVKRSSVIAFVLQKLYLTKYASYWNQICQYTKLNKQSSKLHEYFHRRLNNFTKNYEKQVLVRGSFTLIKNIFSKLVKNDMAKMVDPKMSTLLVTNRNNCFGRVLENILFCESSVIKVAFLRLKENLKYKKAKQSRTDYGAKILGNLESIKLKEYFAILVQFSKLKSQSKSWLLNRCSLINLNYKKNLLKQSLNKLLIVKLKQQASLNKSVSTSKLPAKSTLPSKVQAQSPVQQQQQPKAVKQLRQKLADQQNKLTQLQQKYSGQPTQAQLKQKSKQLKDQKLKYTNQNKQKKQVNNDLKHKLEQLVKNNSGKGNEELESLSGVQKGQKDEGNTLSLLHEIYMRLYKLSQEQCVNEENLNSLWTIHRVQENIQVRENIARWLAIKQNCQLKHEINLYEGNYTAQDPASSTNSNAASMKKKQMYQQLEEQNQIVKKFIRSYIKQRYMWQQVKEYVAAVINQ